MESSGPEYNHQVILLLFFFNREQGKINIIQVYYTQQIKYMLNKYLTKVCNSQGSLKNSSLLPKISTQDLL